MHTHKYAYIYIQWDIGIVSVDFINVSILSITLFNTFARYYHKRILINGQMEFLCIISHNCIWIYNTLKIKNLIIKTNKKSTVNTLENELKTLQALNKYMKSY